MTTSGTYCQSWTLNTNQSFVTDASFPDDSVEAAENYCRNPDPDYLEDVWCYTVDPLVEWESCDVPQCSQAVSFELGSLLGSPVS